MTLIGREEETKELKRIYESGLPEFVAVYGRRRVGKTFLVKEFFNYDFTFYTSGLARGSKSDQLGSFYSSLLQYGLKESCTKPGDWFAAFEALKTVIEQSDKQRKVIFIDELPWMDTQKSEIVMALDRFWNTWASEKPEVMLIICGSAASWMVKNIIKNQGGLHNRITAKLRLLPFTLSETEKFLASRGFAWSRQMILEAYMALGGIPYYLGLLDRNQSLPQNLDRLFFRENARLEDEFDNLFSSLFRKSSEYVRIVECLARIRRGCTRAKITETLGITDGGGLTRRLDELEQCGFIRRYSAKGDSADTYQLTDFYTIFYFDYIKNNRNLDSDFWMHQGGTHRHSVWMGLAFERVCFAHIAQIRKALGISGIVTRTFAYCPGTSQSDMVIERGDGAVTVCEMKCTNTEYLIDKSEAARLQKRKEDVGKLYKNKKTVFLALVTKSGLAGNQYSATLVNNVVTGDDLFS